MPKSAAIPPNSGLPVLSHNTRKAIKGLKEFYQLGHDSLRPTNAHGRSAYGSFTVGKIASQEGMGKSNIYEARNFALSYTPQEFQQLIELCETFNVPFGFSHIVEVKKIGEPELRRRLQEIAVKDRWSVKRLRKEVRKLLKKA